MFLIDMYSVCVKKFSDDTPLQAIKSEAGVLLMLSCEYIPHCFGICYEKRMLVMLYIHLSGTPVSLHLVLSGSQCSSFELTRKLATQLLVDIVKGLLHVHSKGYLHNDLKSDNIVLGGSYSRSIKAYIIDFGKACKATDGKQYYLSMEEKKIYKREHCQIAPDLRDGEVKQTFLTDVFSLARILKKVNKFI